LTAVSCYARTREIAILHETNPGQFAR
jgi:hypothetical protein